jgi:hypothetical protein
MQNPDALRRGIVKSCPERRHSGAHAARIEKGLKPIGQTQIAQDGSRVAKPIATSWSYRWVTASPKPPYMDVWYWEARP